MNRLEKEMGNFESALSELSAKVEAVFAVLARDSAALGEARRVADEAVARADRVVAEDAAEDAATDEARAAALAGVNARLDEILGVAPVEPVVEGVAAEVDEPAVEPVVEEPQQPSE